jgi:hypothetical protein
VRERERLGNSYFLGELELYEVLLRCGAVSRLVCWIENGKEMVSRQRDIPT